MHENSSVLEKFIPQEVLRVKRDGGVLSNQALKDFFAGFLAGKVDDYQVSALLMAILLRGMNPEETANLTTIMRDSGTTLDWTYPRDLIVDKHSTGGVGDKTSLIILPLCLLEGLYVPMISGRGLGHTGGTLDKLESIPGMAVRLPLPKMREMMERFHGGFFGQTEEIAPLDRRLYALRDVTATVESIPLITASILSKKLAEGIGSLVLDVKYGSGAFMVSRDDAEALAVMLVETGRRLDLRVRCCLTDMNSPLGGAAGNALEVAEVLDVLAGAGPKDVRELSIELAAQMVELAKAEKADSDVRSRMAEHLDSGRAFEVFSEVVAAQGGDRTALEDRNNFICAPVTKRLELPEQFRNGAVIKAIDTRKLGVAVQMLGGGRVRVTDTINPFVGLTGMRRCGSKIESGEAIVEIHAQSISDIDQVADLLMSSFEFVESSANVEEHPLLWKVIE